MASSDDGSPPHSAVLEADFDTVQRAERVERSLRPEIGDIEGDRTRAALERDGATVTLTIRADDLVALRAGINTWTTLLSVAERTGESSVK